MYNGSLYVGTFPNGQVLVLNNNVITKIFSINVCSSSYIISLYFDNFGYMGLMCYGQKYYVVYDYNGNYMNIMIPTAINPFISFVDTHGRLILNNQYELDIYF